MNRYFVDNERLNKLKELVKNTINEKDRILLKRLKSKYPSLNFYSKSLYSDWIDTIMLNKLLSEDDENDYKIQYNDLTDNILRKQIFLSYVIKYHKEDYLTFNTIKKWDIPNKIGYNSVLNGYISSLNQGILKGRIEYDYISIHKIIYMTDKELDTYLNDYSIDRVDKKLLKKTETIKKGLDMIVNLLNTDNGIDIDKRFLTEVFRGYIYKNDYTILHNFLVKKKIVK